jgi:hypothetical protein
MGQIPAVHDGKPGKIGEGGVHQIIISSHRTDGRIGIKSRHDWIVCNN